MERKQVAQSFEALKAELDTRMRGLPKAVNNGERLVPVQYDLTVVPLVDDEEYRARELRAQSRPAMREAVTHQSAAFRMFTHAMQSEGIGHSFMTKSERELASAEWSSRLRELCAKSEEQRKQAERYQVVVDLDVD